MKNVKPAYQFIFWAPALILIAYNWLTCPVLPKDLVVEVPRIVQTGFFETKWLYGSLLGFTAFFPLVFGFLPQLKFNRQWGRYLRANLPITLFFIVWDVYFTKIGVWGFSDAYSTGHRFLGLPWEEWAFFVAIPAACVFIFFSLKYLYPKPLFERSQKQVYLVLVGIFFMVGFWKWQHIYTATAFLLAGFFTLWHVLFRPNAPYAGHFLLTYLLSTLGFLVVNGLLTGCATDSPVVLYHPDEFFGLRAGTIPLDDFAYSWLMLFANVVFFEGMATIYHRGIVEEISQSTH